MKAAPRDVSSIYFFVLLEPEPELLLPLEPLLPEPLPDPEEPTLDGFAAPPLMELPALPMPLDPVRLEEPLWPVEP